MADESGHSAATPEELASNMCPECGHTLTEEDIATWFARASGGLGMSLELLTSSSKRWMKELAELIAKNEQVLGAVSPEEYETNDSAAQLFDVNAALKSLISRVRDQTSRSEAVIAQYAKRPTAEAPEV